MTRCRCCGRVMRREKQEGYPPADIPDRWMVTCDNEAEDCQMAGGTFTESGYAAVDLSQYMKVPLK